MVPTRAADAAAAAALLLLAIVFADGGRGAEAKGLSQPPPPTTTTTIGDKENAGAAAAYSRAASHDGADSGLTLPNAVSAAKENEAKLDHQRTHSKKKRNKNKKRTHSHRTRPRISNVPRDDYHKDPSHTVLDDLVQGLARIGVEMLDLKDDLLGDMAEVLRKNKFGHRVDEFEKTSSYFKNDKEKKEEKEKMKEKAKQTFIEARVTNAADGSKGTRDEEEKDGNAEERTNNGSKENDHSGHPLNRIANGLRNFGIGILDVERSAVSGIRSFLRVWRDGMESDTSESSPYRR